MNPPVCSLKFKEQTPAFQPSVPSLDAPVMASQRLSHKERIPLSLVVLGLAVRPGLADLKIEDLGAVSGTLCKIAQQVPLVLFPFNFATFYGSQTHLERLHSRTAIGKSKGSLENWP